MALFLNRLFGKPSAVGQAKIHRFFVLKFELPSFLVGRESFEPYELESVQS